MILPFFFQFLMSVKEPFRNFCETHLVADDPWPLAEESTENLIAFAGLFEQKHLKKELTYRLQNGLIERHLIIQVEEILK